MKCIILAGGFGTRLAEETTNIPKPMVMINGQPILWHLMSIYAKQGFTNFVIATGYKREVIDKWVSTITNNWNVETLDTGLHTQTGGRIAQCVSKFPMDSKFFLTYGDGLSNVNLKNLEVSHAKSKKMVTLTAVRPPARFGYIKVRKRIGYNLVTKFGEKNQADEGWINGGFFIINKEVVDYIDSNTNSFEIDSLPLIAKDKQLNAYKHENFWKPMDTLRDKNELNELAKNNKAPWL
jgi:glucose-1-phosphate cytidylyltransferase